MSSTYTSHNVIQPKLAFAPWTMKFWRYALCQFGPECLIIAVSFRFYALFFYSALNSDHGIVLAMTQQFDGRNDLFFWSQNRIGSQLSMICHSLLTIFPMNHVLLYSILHFAVLILGYLALRSMIQGKHLRWLACVLWFLPLYHFTDFLTFSYGLYFSVFLCAFVVCQRINVATQSKLPMVLRLLLFEFLLFQSLWLNEMALIAILALVTSSAIEYVAKKNNNSFASLFLIVTITFMTVGMYYMFRGLSPNQKNYTELPDLDLLWPSVKTLGYQLYTLVIGQGKEYFTALFLIVLITLYFGILSKMRWSRLKEILLTDSFIRFLLLHIVLTLFLVCTSSWVNEMLIPRRYFCVFALEVALLCVLLLNHIQMKWKWTIPFGVVVSVCSVGSICTHLWVFPKTLQPRRSLEMDFVQLGEAGLIGDYWTTYVVQGLYPNIIATPHDLDDVKHLKQVKDVMAQPTIYLIQDMWLDQFPEEIVQFNTKLYRIGDQKKCGSMTICAYSTSPPGP
jgi:hypothetical protein